MSRFLINNNDIIREDLPDLLNLMTTLSEKQLTKMKSKLQDISYWQRIMKHSDIATVRDSELNNRIVGIGMLVEHIQGFGHYSIEDVVRNSDYSNYGIGSMIMKKLHDIAKDRGIKEVVLTSNKKK